MSFPGRVVQRAWHLVDAKDQTVGRLATQIAPILRGKHKPTYRPNADCGDFVVVINAEKVRSPILLEPKSLGSNHFNLPGLFLCGIYQVRFSGKKWDQKLYRWHTGYPGESTWYFSLKYSNSHSSNACIHQIIPLKLNQVDSNNELRTI